MKKFYVLVPLLLLFLPMASAQELSFETEGKCQEFNVTVHTYDFEPGNYDVKVDVNSDGGRVGEIYDPVGGWQSTMYYVNGALEVKEENGRTYGNATVDISADSRNNLTMFARLRQNDRTWTSEKREVTQNCPERENIESEKFILISLVAVLLILVGVTIYKKR